MKICAKCNGSFEEGIAYCPNDGSRLTTISKLQLAGQSVPESVVEHAAQVEAEAGVEDLVGKTIAARYKVRRRLGEGGMGVVYAGVDMRLEKEVAIKVLKEDFAHRSDVVTRFTQEAKSAARIKHENVLDVTDYGQTEHGSFYIAMELLVGTDLADLLQKHGTIDPQRAINIALQITRALSAAHAKGIVHRDLKPENVFLVQADDGREVVKIVDFGIAQMKDLSGDEGGASNGRKLTRTGMIFGTPEYMSPEQAAGKPIDHRVDIYAVGVILYEMLAGRVPFVGDTFMGVLTQHMFEAPPPIKAMRPDANVPPDLEAVISKALAKDPAQRYLTMQELTDDLARVRDHERPTAQSLVIPVPVRPGGAAPPAVVSQPSQPPPARTSAPQRNVAMLGLVGLGAAALIVAGVVALRAFGPGAGAAGTGTTTVAGNGHVPAHGVPTTPTALDAGAPVHPTTPAGTGLTAVATPDAGAATVPALAATLRVQVATTPAGARIAVAGEPALGCAQTPCTLELPRGREVRLQASAGRRRGELSVTPQTDGQEVTIALAGGTTGGTRPPSSGTGGGGHARGQHECCPICRRGGGAMPSNPSLRCPCLLIEPTCGN